MIQAKITDIQPDDKKEFAVIGIEINNNGQKYHRGYKIDLAGKVTFEEIRHKVLEDVIKDMKKESERNDKLEELVKHKGIPFNIEIPSTSIPSRDAETKEVI